METRVTLTDEMKIEAINARLLGLYGNGTLSHVTRALNDHWHIEYRTASRTESRELVGRREAEAFLSGISLGISRGRNPHST